MTDYICIRCGAEWSVNDGKAIKFEVEYCFDCYLDELEI